MSSEQHKYALQGSLRFREVLRKGDILLPSTKYLGDLDEVAFKVNKIYRVAGDDRFIAAVEAKTIHIGISEEEEKNVIFRRGDSVTDLSYQNYSVIRFGRNR